MEDYFPPTHHPIEPVDADRVEHDIEDIRAKYNPYAVILEKPAVYHYRLSALAYRTCCEAVEKDNLFNGYLASVHELSQSAHSLNQLLDKWSVRCSFERRNPKHMRTRAFCCSVLKRTIHRAHSRLKRLMLVATKFEVNSLMRSTSGRSN